MGMLNKKYQCNSCGHIFDESNAKWVDIDFEGKDTIDNDSVMDSLPLCPKCGSDNLSEYYEEEKSNNNKNSDVIISIIKLIFIAAICILGGIYLFGTMKSFIAFVVVMLFLGFLTK